MTAIFHQSKILQAITNNRDISLQSEVIRQADELVRDAQFTHTKTMYQLKKSERQSALLRLQHILVDFSAKEWHLIEGILDNLSLIQ